jgi:hypothetical protein
MTKAKAKEAVTPIVRVSVVNQVVSDLTHYTYNDIKIGESFKTKGIFRGVSEEPLDWRLVEMNISRSHLQFDVSYYGILVGTMSIYPSENCRVQSK